MLQYSRLQLATIVAVPIVTIILIWTVAIFYKNKRYWKCFDTAIVAVLIQSILRNSTIIAYTVLQMINQSSIHFEYCTVFVWIFNSIHTFQASTLSTLAVTALFSIKLYRKRESLKNYLTIAHIVYHLFCLTTLCACVGVAAILAKQKNNEYVVMFDFFPLNLCKFMPYEMDVKYNVFIVTLHSFLAIISLVAFVSTCYNFYVCKKDGFEYVKKSNSDLSELSIGSANLNYQRPYYEGYGDNGKVENGQPRAIMIHPHHHQQTHWTSDMSNISTTVSSTNSRRPCLGKQVSEEEAESIGLETILPILTVCYLFNHVPIIILCVFPWLIAPWSVATAALCLGLLQDVLVPLSLGLVDTRFCQWISNLYRCTDRDKLNDKLPQVGLDGKFRPFGTHSTAMEIPQTTTQTDRQKSFQIVGNEPKFPITNGSLYTSVDGRVPIIHNYRRHKDRNIRPIENNLINLGVHATYLKQHQDLLQSPQPTMMNNQQEHTCSTSCNDQKRNKKKTAYAPRKRVSLSQNGINSVGHDNEIAFHRRQANRLRLSKSEDSLCEIEKCGDFEQKILLRCEKNQVSDSDDDYFSDVNMDIAARVSDDESSKSSYSITTEANCDFEFYQAKTDPSYGHHETFQYLQLSASRLEEPKQEPLPILQTFKPPQLLPRISDNFEKQAKIVKVDVNRNFRITRSNSKRSLENFKAYIDDSRHLDNSDAIHSNHHGHRSQRSYSYVDLDDTIRRNNNNNTVGDNKFELAWTGLDLSFTKEQLGGKKQMNPSGSVPDLKKIFISDYL